MSNTTFTVAATRPRNDLHISKRADGVYVNSEQVVADTILRRMGSHYNPWASSDNHSTKVRVHVINVKAAAEILINHGVLRNRLGGLQDYPGTVEHSEYLDKLCKGL